MNIYDSNKLTLEGRKNAIQIKIYKKFFNNRTLEDEEFLQLSPLIEELKNIDKMLASLHAK